MPAKNGMWTVGAVARLSRMALDAYEPSLTVGLLHPQVSGQRKPRPTLDKMIRVLWKAIACFNR